MKSFISLFALAAAANGEADPQTLVYQPTVYHQPAAVPVVHQTPYVAASPILKSIVPTPIVQTTYAQKVVSEDQKKVAEVEYKTPVVASTYVHTPYVQTPYVQAPVVQTPYVSTYAHPQVYAAQPIQPVVHKYEAVPKYVAKNGEVEHKVYKRESEAEADPAFFYNGAYATPYAGAYATPYAYSPYTAASLAAPVAYSPYTAAYTTPYYTAPVVPAGVKTYANDVFKPQNYASKGQYVAANAGAIHVAKRSADAESDPGFLYANNVYTTPYTAGYQYARTYAATPFAARYTTPYAYSPYTAGVYNTAYATPSVYGQYYL